VGLRDGDPGPCAFPMYSSFRHMTSQLEPPGEVVDRSVHLGALAAYAVVVGTLAAVGYVYAVRRVGGYTY